MPQGISTAAARFGGFVVDARERTLFKHGVRVRLHGQAFEILILLLERPGQVITREELQAKLWPSDTFVDFENGLNVAIRKLRQTLGDSAEMPRYIETVPRIGYRFVARVLPVTEPISALGSGPLTDGSPRRTNGIDNGARSRNGQSASEPTADVVLAPEAQNAEPARPTVEPSRVAGSAQINTTESVSAARSKRKSTAASVLMALAAVVGVALILSIAFLTRPAAPIPRVKRIRQITDVGNVSGNQNIALAGSHLYFQVSEKGEMPIRSVSLDDNTISQIQSPFPEVELHDVSPSGNELLIGRFEQGVPAQWARTLWRLPIPLGSPNRVGTMFADDANFSPDGRTIAYASEADQSLNLVDVSGKNSIKIVDLPGRPFKPRWSPDGKTIRISVLDTRTGGVLLWQLDASGKNLKRVLPRWNETSRAWAGRWTPDGRYFLFAGSEEGPRNIWALRDKKAIFHKVGNIPVRLTNGPLNYTLVALSSDGKTIYAVGLQRRGQLMRYDMRSRQFEPYANGLSGDQVAFSPDGRSIAWVSYPEGTLVTSRLDGSQQLQLTFPPLRVFKPRWALDGTQIVFSAVSPPDTANKIYLMPARGGPARLLAAGIGAEQYAPDCLRDGHSLLFTSLDNSGRSTLHLFDLKTSRDELLPGTLGLSEGRLSPDGRFVTATASSGLVVYEIVSHEVRQLAQIADYPAWSADGKYVYYNTLMQGALVGPDQIGIYRVAIADGKIERIASTPGFPIAISWGMWTGLAPDGSILLLREVGTSDIYALDVDFP